MLRTTLVQTDILWEDAGANVAAVRRWLDRCSPNAGELIVLPEMFATGFSMDVAAVDAAAAVAREALREFAVETGCLVMGGVACAESNDPGGNPAGAWGRNEAFAFGPGGDELSRYQKVRTFSYTQEAKHYRRGRKIEVFAWENWRICPLICYDLRFPELFRAGLDMGAEVYVVMANWPEARVEHWVTLLRARAMENQAYVVGVNRAGTDPRYVYPGRSLVVDPHGVIQADAGSDAGTIRCSLDREVLLGWREEFPAWKDRVTAVDLDD